MKTIKKSVKQIIMDLLRENGEMPLKDISDAVNGAREGLHPSHVRGVLNRDIKNGSKIFKRAGRGKYALQDVVPEGESKSQPATEGKPSVEEPVSPVEGGESSVAEPVKEGATEGDS